MFEDFEDELSLGLLDDPYYDDEGDERMELDFERDGRYSSEYPVDDWLSEGWVDVETAIEHEALSEEDMLLRNMSDEEMEKAIELGSKLQKHLEENLED